MLNQKTELGKKWTWYLYLGANFLIILGIAISWILYSNALKQNPNIIIIPTIVCNIASAIMFSFFVFYETKNISYVYMHINKKWLRYFMASGVFYGAMFLLSIVLFIITRLPVGLDWLTIMIIDFSVNAFLSLICMGLFRYGRFKIDLDIFRRKQGIEAEEVKKSEEERKKRENLSDEEYKNILKDKEKTGSNQCASSGLIDHVEK